MIQKKFDLVMDYIDENIQKDNETIKSGIQNLIGINSFSFGHFFSYLTGGDNLNRYIKSRRAYHAIMELKKDSSKTILEIALDYGYSDHSSFTRAITQHYGIPPSELRRNTRSYIIQNSKYHYEDFEENNTDSRSSRIWKEFERTGCIINSNIEFLESIDHGHKEYGFDIDTCYAIADLSERLDITVSALMNACFDLVVEFQSDPYAIANDELVAIDLGIRSYQDLEKICEYYSCQYYELTSHMVDDYYSSHP